MRFQLVARITDVELLRKSIHELGTVFYQTDGEGNITKVVYFSGSRVVEFVGKVDEALARRVKAEGHRVELIEVDEFQGCVRVIQG
ncbi:MAG: hypothetical protein ACQXXG_10035 [Candidatus Bathyarchaeia archaeon]